MKEQRGLWRRMDRGEPKIPCGSLRLVLVLAGDVLKAEQD